MGGRQVGAPHQPRIAVGARLPGRRPRPELVGRAVGLDGDPPLGVLLLDAAGAAVDAGDAERAVACGIHHWQPLRPDADGAIAAADVEAALALARARHLHDHALRRAAARAHEQLDERKWVDRAKGVLMSARGLGEDEAFRLLRGAAMSVNLRIGELSRAVCEAARWADAMNRAGQLRMLSQRLVRLAAQQLLKIDARDSAALKAQSAQRVRDNLEMLAQQCADTSRAAGVRARRAVLAARWPGRWRCRAWTPRRCAASTRSRPRCWTPPSA